MGQMLSREDDDERQHDESQHADVEDSAAEVKEKPKRRQRNTAAVRSRRPRAAIRTRRNRTTNSITFDVREH